MKILKINDANYFFFCIVVIFGFCLQRINDVVEDDYAEPVKMLV